MLVQSAAFADIERPETRPNDFSEQSCAGKAAWPTVIETLDRAKILIRLRQVPLLWLILNPFGTTAKVLELDGDMLRATTRGQNAHLFLADVCGPPSVRKGAFSSTMKVRSSAQAETILRGASYVEAVDFSDQVKRAWIEFNLAALKREADRFDRLHTAISALATPARYPAACSIEPLLVSVSSGAGGKPKRDLHTRVIAKSGQS